MKVVVARNPAPIPTISQNSFQLSLNGIFRAAIRMSSTGTAIRLR